MGQQGDQINFFSFHSVVHLLFKASLQSSHFCVRSPRFKKENNGKKEQRPLWIAALSSWVLTPLLTKSTTSEHAENAIKNDIKSFSPCTGPRGAPLVTSLLLCGVSTADQHLFHCTAQLIIHPACTFFHSLFHPFDCRDTDGVHAEDLPKVRVNSKHCSSSWASLPIKGLPLARHHLFSVTFVSRKC